MITTSNLQPVGGDDISEVDLRSFIASTARADRAEIKVGNVGVFSAWLERKFGSVKSYPARAAPTTFAGVPVVKSVLLPPNIAALIVNGEMRAILNMDKDSA